MSRSGPGLELYVRHLYRYGFAFTEPRDINSDIHLARDHRGIDYPGIHRLPQSASRAVHYRGSLKRRETCGRYGHLLPSGTLLL
jgi:hypothetical protein